MPSSSSSSFSKAGSRRYSLRELKSLSDAERKAILKRDCNTCRICGSRVSLEVHHIEGEFADPLPEIYNAEKNLITLCRHCHAGITSMELKYLEIYRFIIMPQLLAMATVRQI